MDTGIGLDQPAHMVDVLLDDRVTHLQMVVQHSRNARQGRVAGPLPQPVDGRMDSPYARLDSGHDIRHGQIVIVVGMEVEMQFRITLDHLAAERIALVGSEHAERIGDHETRDRPIAQRVDHPVNVILGKAHAVRPVLQIEIDRDTLGRGSLDRLANIGYVLFGRLAQLQLAMAQRTFGKQIHHAASGIGDPPQRNSAVDETQNLHPVEKTAFLGPAGDTPHRLELSVGNPGRGYLNPVDMQFVEQQTRDAQLLAHGKRHSRSLLAVAQGRIQYFDAIHHRQSISFSKSVRKSVPSPRPTGRQGVGSSAARSESPALVPAGLSLRPPDRSARSITHGATDPEDHFSLSVVLPTFSERRTVKRQTTHAPARSGQCRRGC